uniref:MSP domain-containing protein n=1 Tax=Ditylenchus dipsaci TaxID=166011 RepID=A0A915CVV3_9BILA
MENGNFSTASSEKQRIEQKQRAKHTQVSHSPMWFDAVQGSDEYGRAGQWQFNGKYCKGTSAACTSNELFRIRPAVGILEPQRNEDVKAIFNACKILPEDSKHYSVVYHISAKNDVSAKKRKMYGELRGTMGNYYSCGAYKGTPTAALIPSPVASTPDESNFVVGSIRVSIDHDPVMYCCSDCNHDNNPLQEAWAKNAGV